MSTRIPPRSRYERRRKEGLLCPQKATMKVLLFLEKSFFVVGGKAGTVETPLGVCHRQKISGHHLPGRPIATIFPPEFLHSHLPRLINETIIASW